MKVPRALQGRCRGDSGEEQEEEQSHRRSIVVPKRRIGLLRSASRGWHGSPRIGSGPAEFRNARNGFPSTLIPHEVVDTTAAGDAFMGGLAVALGEGRPLLEAARFAVQVAAASVTRPGAQPSLPTREDLPNGA